jgi:hypothetical protein
MSSCPTCERGEPLGPLARRATTWITTEPEPSAPGLLPVTSRRRPFDPYRIHGTRIPHLPARAIPRCTADEPVPDVEGLHEALR